MTSSAPQNKQLENRLRPAADDAAKKTARMAALLGVEAAAREADTLEALAIRLVNEPRVLSDYGQAFCLRLTSRKNFEVFAITSQAEINRAAPMAQLVETQADDLKRRFNLREHYEFDVRDIDTPWTAEAKLYPFPYFCWFPLESRGELFGGVFFARRRPWRDVEIIILQRILETYAHAWAALKNAPADTPKMKRRLRLIAGTAALACAVSMWLPVPYTATAPAEVIAANPWIVSAPMDGVISEVYPDPNIQVKKGESLFSFVDTTLRNEARLAGNELLVAEAKLANTSRAALVDPEGRREIAIAESERALSATRKNYADELLNRVNVSAARSGVILFPDKYALNGKPVAVGEKVMEIADPGNIEIMIEITPGDALVLRPGARVKLFLDVDPLRPIEGVIERASYTPEVTGSGMVAYRAFARIDPSARRIPRIGLRGSAKIYGGKTEFGYWLFRKPIVVLRRNLGI